MKTAMKKTTLPVLPGMPAIGAALPALPKLGALPTIGAMPKTKTIAELALEQTNPLDVNSEDYNGNAEHDSALDAATIGDEFKAIREARAKQAAAVELANDSEFWFAVHFQTREQKEAFVQALGIAQDKYIDGQQLAQVLNISLPPRPAPYKIAKVDKKLAELT